MMLFALMVGVLGIIADLAKTCRLAGDALTTVDTTDGSIKDSST